MLSDVKWGERVFELCKSLPLFYSEKRMLLFPWHRELSWKISLCSKKKRKTQMIIISVVALKVHCRVDIGSQKARMMDSGEMERDPARDRAS